MWSAVASAVGGWLGFEETPDMQRTPVFANHPHQYKPEYWNQPRNSASSVELSTEPSYWDYTGELAEEPVEDFPLLQYTYRDSLDEDEGRLSIEREPVILMEDYERSARWDTLERPDDSERALTVERDDSQYPPFPMPEVSSRDFRGLTADMAVIEFRNLRRPIDREYQGFLKPGLRLNSPCFWKGSKRDGDCFPKVDNLCGLWKYDSVFPDAETKRYYEQLCAHECRFSSSRLRNLNCLLKDNQWQGRTSPTLDETSFIDRVLTSQSKCRRLSPSQCSSHGRINCEWFPAVNRCMAKAVGIHTGEDDWLVAQLYDTCHFRETSVHCDTDDDVPRFFVSPHESEDENGY